MSTQPSGQPVVVAPSKALARAWGRSLKGGMLGLAIGWLVALLCWAALAFYFEGANQLQSLAEAALVATPWALAGGIVGATGGCLQSNLVPLAALLGLVAAIAYTFATRQLDLRLALTMPYYLLIGLLAGLIVGVVVTLVVRGTRRSRRETTT